MRSDKRHIILLIVLLGYGSCMYAQYGGGMMPDLDNLVKDRYARKLIQQQMQNSFTQPIIGSDPFARPAPPKPYNMFEELDDLMPDIMTSRHRRQQQEALLNNYTAIDKYGNVRTGLSVQEKISIETKRKWHLEALDKGFTSYASLWSEMIQMFNSRDINLKDAIYKIESFYNPDYMCYQEYIREIDKARTFILDAMNQEGFACDDQMALKMMLHRYMTGTIEIKDADGNILRSKPMKYSFDDPMGSGQTENQFVLKLIKTRKGQCHSLPLFYLIMAEELSIEAWLARSPAHMYIKIKDQNDQWYNLELTNGHYTNDHWVMSSGKVSAEAIREGLYLRPMEKHEVLELCMTDLVNYYIQRFGNDPRIFEDLDQLVKKNPRNITAWLTLSNYITEIFLHEADRLGIHSKEQVGDHDTTKQFYRVLHEIYGVVENLGYSPFTSVEYKEWLFSFNDSNKEKILRP